MQILPGLALSRSYTSRAARPGEADGVDYNFITRARFEAMIAADAFLEWADVFGNLYGTGAADTERELAAGRDLVLVIDVQGARQVRHALPGDRRHLRAAAVVRACSSSGCAAAARTPRRPCSAGWRRRGPRSPPVAEYDYVIVNDELDACVQRLQSVVLAERSRLRMMRPLAEQIVRSFLERADSGTSD